MFTLGDGNVYQVGKLARQFVALVLNRTGVLPQALQLRDLAIERRDLAGQPIYLVNRLRH